MRDRIGLWPSARAGGFSLFYRKPNRTSPPHCRRHPTLCRDVAQLEETSPHAAELQGFVLAHRRGSTMTDVLREWLRCLADRDWMRHRVAALRLAHPTWHRLKCLDRAKAERQRVRRAEADARDPIRAARRREHHPRWARTARRARNELRRKTDKLDRAAYTGGLRFPRHYMPDDATMIARKQKQKGPRFTKPLPPRRKPFKPLPVQIHQEREAAAIVASEALPPQRRPTPGIGRRAGAAPPPPAKPSADGLNSEQRRRRRRAAERAAGAVSSEPPHAPI